MTPTTLADPRPPAPIDPRMRARRIAVRRDEGRRRLSRLVRLFVLAVVVVALILATRTPLLDVDHFDVAGNAHTATADVERVSGIAKGAAMTDLDVHGAERAIVRLPWVARVTVSRSWPGTVRVRITERRAVAAVAAAQGAFLAVDETGRLLEELAAVPSDLVLLADVAPGTKAGDDLPAADRDALAVARAVPDDLVGTILAVAPREGGGLELRLANGAVVAFGGPDQVGEKLVAVATVLAQVDGRCMALLDVRVPTSTVLTRTPGCA